MQLEELLTEFHLDIEDFEAQHCGHDYRIDDNLIRFSGGWEAGHEAWLFKRWLDKRGIEAVMHSSKAVAVVDLPDVPDWVEITPQTAHEASLSAMGVRIRCDYDDIEAGVEKLKRKMWEDVAGLPGIGKKIAINLRGEFETPLHGAGSFQTVDGVGSSTADKLNRYVTNG